LSFFRFFRWSPSVVHRLLACESGFCSPVRVPVGSFAHVAGRGFRCSQSHHNTSWRLMQCVRVSVRRLWFPAWHGLTNNIPSPGQSAEAPPHSLAQSGPGWDLLSLVLLLHDKATIFLP